MTPFTLTASLVFATVHGAATIPPHSVSSVRIGLINEVRAVQGAGDADISQDYPIEHFSFFGNESWAITGRPEGAVWVHESRFHTTVNATKRALAAESDSRLSEKSFLEGIKINVAPGAFTCPDNTWFAAPQQCTNYGSIIGHTYVTLIPSILHLSQY
ncbi:hypothetical protein TruAng_007224 [Truncatella angustata]|nr:hypothetical protein TruAng_007224 [Truncatella angustata]